MLASLARSAIGIASPRGKHGRLSVLIYHRVLRDPDPLLPDEPSEAEFESTMKWVKQVFNVLPLEQAAAALQAGTLPARALCITFDDGYANNATIAAPILARLGLHATFFVATGFLDGGRMFNDTVIEAVRAFDGEVLDLRPLGLDAYPAAAAADKLACVDAILRVVKHRAPDVRRALVEGIADTVQLPSRSDLMMTSAQVTQLVAMGFGVGAHTINHPILARLAAEQVRAEIETGARRLAELTGDRIALFAYPNGRPDHDYRRASVEVVRSLGFNAAVSTSPGAARVGSDLFQIPRFTPWDKSMVRFAARMLSNLTRTEPIYAAT